LHTIYLDEPDDDLIAGKLLVDSPKPCGPSYVPMVFAVKALCGCPGAVPPGQGPWQQYRTWHRKAIISSGGGCLMLNGVAIRAVPGG
jgi:hypothetical protein